MLLSLGMRERHVHDACWKAQFKDQNTLENKQNRTMHWRIYSTLYRCASSVWGWCSRLTSGRELVSMGESRRLTAKDTRSAAVTAAPQSGPAIPQIIKQQHSALPQPTLLPQLWSSGLSPGSQEDLKMVSEKQEYFGVMRHSSPILIILQSFLKCHKFGLRRENSDFLPECVASWRFASVNNKTIAIWLSPTLGRHEISEPKADTSERSPVWWKLPVQNHFMKSHLS